MAIFNKSLKVYGFIRIKLLKTNSVVSFRNLQ